MSRFVVCPSCERHVRRSEESCPFCNELVPAAVRQHVHPAPPAGLSRARAYAFRAALLASSAAVACSSSGENPPWRRRNFRKLWQRRDLGYRWNRDRWR